MAFALQISVEEYLRTSYDPDVEYANGELVRRNVGTQLHGMLQLIVGAYFHQVRQDFKIKAFTETRLRLDSATGRHCIPDVMVLEKPFGRGKVVTDVPAVVIEIKSPDDTFDEVIDKCFAYAALGVANIVVMDPDSRRVYVFANQTLQCLITRQREIDLVLHLPKSRLELPFPVDTMFEEMDD